MNNLQVGKGGKSVALGVSLSPYITIMPHPNVVRKLKPRELAHIRVRAPPMVLLTIWGVRFLVLLFLFLLLFQFLVIQVVTNRNKGDSNKHEEHGNPVNDAEPQETNKD